jgi:hypothetical protein
LWYNLLVSITVPKKEKSKMAKQHFYLMIADVTGDTRIMVSWDPEDPNSVEEMKAKFNELKRKGYIFYECEGFEGNYTTKGAPVKNFVPAVGQLIGEPYFDDLEYSESEEVILTGTMNETEETSFFDPNETSLKDGSTYGAAKMLSGG